jgi:probable addiction module antidote protein
MRNNILSANSQARLEDAKKYRDQPNQIAAFLNGALDTGDPLVISQAIGRMIRAHSWTYFAAEMGIRREVLQRSFNGSRNPAFSTVVKVMDQLGLQFVVRPTAEQRDDR